MELSSLVAEGQELASELIQFRRDLHRYPELSLQESESSAKVAMQLQQLGLEVQTGVGGFNLIAELKGEQPGPTIALRADMDALPIHEESGVEFASLRTGIMHACGHDAHTAMLLGAAKLLTTKKIKGTIRFLFQGAEEINAGAKALIEHHALNGVDEIYGLHNLPTLPAGLTATRRGSLMGSVDRIEIYLEGRGGHGAIPDKSIDPIVCASNIVMALQSIVSREMSPFDPVVVTIGSIKAGEANNVIPHYAEMSGTIRTFNSDVQKQMPERIERIVKLISEGYQCKVKLNYIEQTPVLVNDDECVSQVEQVIDKMIGPECRKVAEPTLAGEDFSIYLQHVPGCFFWLGSGPLENASRAYGLHHPKYELNEACISLGASLLAGIAYHRLSVDK